MSTTAKKAAAATEEIDYSAGMMNAAPTKNKCERYLKLPGSLPLFDPKDDNPYRLIFFPWLAGEGNPAGPKGTPVVNRFLFVHKNIGSDNEWHLCPSKTLGQPCEVCKQKAKFLAENRGKPWKSIEDTVKTMNYSDREIFLIHDLEGKPNNLQVWEEACYSFGNHLRKWINLKMRYRSFASPKTGMVIEVTGTEKQIGTGKFVEFSMIQFSDRETPVPKELIAKAAKFCLDDYVKPSDSALVKKTFLMTGVHKEEEEEETVEAPAEEEEAVEEEVEEETPAEEEEPTEEEEVVEEETEEEVEEETPAEEEEPAEETEEESTEEEEEPTEEEPEEEPAPKPAAKKPAAKPTTPAKKSAVAPATKPAAKPAVKPTVPAKKPAAKK